MKRWVLAALWLIGPGLAIPAQADNDLPTPPAEAFAFGKTKADDTPDPTEDLQPNGNTDFSVSMDEIAKNGGHHIAKFPLTVNNIGNGRPIPPKYAYCTANGKGGIKNGGNVNPALHWFGAPSGTRSYAVIVVDPDVPSNFNQVNQDNRVISADFPRQNFYHWVLVDIPASRISVLEGADSKGIVSGGKPVGKTDYGVDGENDYAAKAGQGQGGGYDGPCPPWNDMRLHHYRFIVYALDVPSLDMVGKFTGPMVERAMAGHILGRGEVVGTYTTNPRLLVK